MKKIKIAIIGAGSAGLSARREVAKVTDDWLVFDPGKIGTTCARVGCMPSKVLIQVAADYYRRKSIIEEGIHGGEKLTINTKEAMAHVRKLRDRFVRGVTGAMSEWTSEKLVAKKATILSPNTLEAGGEVYEFERLVIATGSSPHIADNFKDYMDFLVTTDEFFELEDLPKSVAVIGLGVIGIELGQSLSRLGVNFIGINRRRKIANLTDPKIKEYACSKLEEEMNISFSGVEKIERRGEKLSITTNGKEYLVDKVMMTTGRRPNISGLGLDKLGIKENEIPKYDANTMQLNGLEHIYLTGDATGDRTLLHEASDEGKIAGYNAVRKNTKFKTREKLDICFSDPNTAVIGKSYTELEEAGIKFEIGEVSFEGQGRSIVKLKEIGMLRVYGDKVTGLVLGAELFAPDGEHLAHLLSWVISMKMTVNAILALPFYHPVIEEGLRTALRDLRGKCLEKVPLMECDFSSKDL